MARTPFQNRLHNGVPDEIDSQQPHVSRRVVESTPTIWVLVISVLIFTVMAVARAFIKSRTDYIQLRDLLNHPAEWSGIAAIDPLSLSEAQQAIFINETVDSRVWAAAFLGTAAVIAVQQAMRGLTSARLATERVMREESLKHIRDKMVQFRDHEEDAIESIKKRFEVRDDWTGVYIRKSDSEDGVRNRAEPVPELVLNMVQNDTHIRIMVRLMLESLEQLGAGVARGVYDFVMVDITTGATIIDTWTRWHGFATQRRSDFPLHDQSLDQLQWIASLILHWRILQKSTMGRSRFEMLRLLQHDHYKVDSNPAYIINPNSILHHLWLLSQDQKEFIETVRRVDPTTMKRWEEQRAQTEDLGGTLFDPDDEAED